MSKSKVYNVTKFPPYVEFSMAGFQFLSFPNKKNTHSVKEEVFLFCHYSQYLFRFRSMRCNGINLQYGFGLLVPYLIFQFRDSSSVCSDPFISVGINGYGGDVIVRQSICGGVGCPCGVIEFFQASRCSKPFVSLFVDGYGDNHIPGRIGIPIGEPVSIIEF